MQRADVFMGTPAVFYFFTWPLASPQHCKLARGRKNIVRPLHCDLAVRRSSAKRLFTPPFSCCLPRSGTFSYLFYYQHDCPPPLSTLDSGHLKKLLLLIHWLTAFKRTPPFFSCFYCFRLCEFTHFPFLRYCIFLIQNKPNKQFFRTLRVLTPIL